MSLNFVHNVRNTKWTSILSCDCCYYRRLILWLILHFCSLGASHDGDENDCQTGDNYIMTPFLGGPTNIENSRSFSNCSTDYFRSYLLHLDNKYDNFISLKSICIYYIQFRYLHSFKIYLFYKKSNNNCLTNNGDIYNITEYEEILNDLPGQKYSLDEQCQDLTGDSTAYSVAPFPTVCSVVTCRTPSNSRTHRFYNQALNFTTCGHKKVNLKSCQGIKTNSISYQFYS